MRMNRSLFPLAGAALIAMGMTSACQKKAEAPQGPEEAEATEAAFPDWGQGAAPAPQAKVDPKAVQAIQDITKYLS